MDFWKLEFRLDFKLGIPGKVTETMRRDYERCLCWFLSVFSLLRNVSYFNLSSLNFFFRSRKQTIYCNDSVLQINSSILWVIKTVNPFHTAFQLHSIQWITPLAMLCYTNFLSNFNANTMAGVISDSSQETQQCFSQSVERGMQSRVILHLLFPWLLSLWTSPEKFLFSITYKKQPCTFFLKILTPGRVIKIFPIIRWNDEINHNSNNNNKIIIIITVSHIKIPHEHCSFGIILENHCLWFIIPPPILFLCVSLQKCLSVFQWGRKEIHNTPAIK